MNLILMSVPKTASTSHRSISVRCEERAWCVVNLFFSECSVGYLKHTRPRYYQCMEHSPAHYLYCIYGFRLDFYNGCIFVESLQV